jgi:hypothetical protein
VFGWSYFWFSFAKNTFCFYKFDRIYQFPATITLISFCIRKLAHWASTTYKSICQKSFARFAILLLYNFFICIALFL